MKITLLYILWNREKWKSIVKHLIEKTIMETLQLFKELKYEIFYIF